MVAVIVMAILFAAFVTCLYCMLVVASKADDAMEAEAERRLTEITPVPMETKAIVTYPVPLDQELQDYIVQTCLEYEVSPCVVFAIIGVESGYDTSKIGDNGKSWGLMQIYSTQHTARCVRLGAWNLLDPKMNVRVGIDYLAELLSTGHDIEWCLSWYNGHGGEPCEYARTVLCNAEQILEGVMVHE